MRNFFLLVAVVAGGLWLAHHFGVIGDVSSDIVKQGHGAMTNASKAELDASTPKTTTLPTHSP